MKLVKEHIIFEKFTEDSDPIRDMGIGLRHKIQEWIREYKAESAAYHLEAIFTINNDLTIDVEGHVNLYAIELKKLPDYVKFNKVSGTFWINKNKLTTLKGCPKYVGEDFFCCDNQLTSLKYAPEIVKGVFGVWHNKKQFTEEDVRKVCTTGRIALKLGN